MIRLKRAYDTPEKQDGLRILVERLWPRGVSKAAGKIDLWCRDLAPSTELRTWFAHDPAKWRQFRKRYAAELSKHHTATQLLKHIADNEPVTFVFAAADWEHNSAILLKDFLENL